MPDLLKIKWLEQREDCIRSGACHQPHINADEGCARTISNKDMTFTEFLGYCSPENCWRIKEKK